MDITHFKALLKEKSSEALKHLSSEEKLPADEGIEEAGTFDDDDGLVRDTKYYDRIGDRESTNG